MIHYDIVLLLHICIIYKLDKSRNKCLMLYTEINSNFKISYKHAAL